MAAELIAIEEDEKAKTARKKKFNKKKNKRNKMKRKEKRKVATLATPLSVAGSDAAPLFVAVSDAAPLFVAESDDFDEAEFAHLLSLLFLP